MSAQRAPRSRKQWHSSHPGRDDSASHTSQEAEPTRPRVVPVDPCGPTHREPSSTPSPRQIALYRRSLAYSLAWQIPMLRRCTRSSPPTASSRQPSSTIWPTFRPGTGDHHTVWLFDTCSIINLSYCQPVACSRRPPVAKAELGARGNDPVEDHQSDVGPHGCRSVRASRPDHLIDDLGDTKTFDHRPGSCEVTESEVPGPLGDRCRTCHCSLDVLGFSQVALPGHLRLAVHPGHLAQVVIALPVDLLGDDGSHALGNTPSGDKSRAFDQDIRAGQEPFWKKVFRKAATGSSG